MVAVKKVVKKPAKAPGGSKPAAKRGPAKKAVARKKAPAAVKRQAPTREVDANGFVPNGDSALIAWALLAGGKTRGEVTELATEWIDKTNGINTRNGTPKNVQSLISGVLTRLEERGYTIEGHYRLVPPPEIAAEVKKGLTAVKTAQTKAASKPAPAAKKTAAKKAPAKKVAKKVVRKKA